MYPSANTKTFYSGWILLHKPIYTSTSQRPVPCTGFPACISFCACAGAVATLLSSRGAERRVQHAKAPSRASNLVRALCSHRWVRDRLSDAQRRRCGVQGRGGGQAWRGTAPSRALQCSSANVDTRGSVDGSRGLEVYLRELRSPRREQAPWGGCSIEQPLHEYLSSHRARGGSYNADRGRRRRV